MHGPWKLAYTVAHGLVRLMRRMTGIRIPGAFTAVWCGNRLLIVKTSYQPFTTLPGGMSRRREDPRLSAVRELCEETGLRLDAEMLTRVRDSPMQAKLDREAVALFTTVLPNEPPLRVDGREITWAGFVDRTDPRIASLWPPFRDYVYAASATFSKPAE